MWYQMFGHAACFVGLFAAGLAVSSSNSCYKTKGPDDVSIPKQWPASYWQRVGVAAGFFLPLAFLSVIVASLILQQSIIDAMVWFGIFGIVAVLAASVTAAGLNAGGSPIAFLPRQFSK